MIKDYESGKWDFDITTIVKNIKVEVPCPKYVCKRGFTKRLCLTITNDDLFLKEFDRYLNGYIRPAQELRKNLILARRIFVKNMDILPDIIKIVQMQDMIAKTAAALKNVCLLKN